MTGNVVGVGDEVAFWETIKGWGVGVGDKVRWLWEESVSTPRVRKAAKIKLIIPKDVLFLESATSGIRRERGRFLADVNNKYKVTGRKIK